MKRQSFGPKSDSVWTPLSSPLSLPHLLLNAKMTSFCTEVTCQAVHLFDRTKFLGPKTLTCIFFKLIWQLSKQSPIVHTNHTRPLPNPPSQVFVFAEAAITSTRTSSFNCNYRNKCDRHKNRFNPRWGANLESCRRGRCWLISSIYLLGQNTDSF